ncbi:hypothetical protein CDV31_011424 [Fusarium ambrosium]|uniref:Uncharacterized protein n=1 Tax=Fusarium ambrosium TaxID=131363 RepID=A0A428TGW4_9HYPO|nr:hypothetical protein CDV31_011424 [Fusarium ambrosium]
MGLGLLNTENDAQAFIMIDINATADINDAKMFYKRLTIYREDKLLRSYKKAIDETEKALQVFRGVFGLALEVFRQGIKPKGIRRKLKWVLSDRRAARSLALPLQYAQSNLSRRTNWMLRASDRWIDPPFYDEEEGELPSSMPPKSASTKLASSVPPNQRD